jgi:hypothetical protein
LNPERLAMLEALGFVWDALDDRFLRHLDALRCFVRREGHGRVPRDHIEGDYRLGVWVSSIRAKRDALTSNRRAQLEDAGFFWGSLDERFAQNLELLKGYVAREGHARVPHGYVDDGVRLGNWVSNLRVTRATVPPERVAKLDEAGFVWDPYAEHHDRHLDVLRRYVARTGHARVPQSHVEEGLKLGVWVASLRARRATLAANRIAELDTLGFVWSVRAKKQRGAT